VDPASGNEKDKGRKTRKQTKEEFDVRIRKTVLYTLVLGKYVHANVGKLLVL